MIKIILSKLNVIIKNQRSAEASTPLKIESMNSTIKIKLHKLDFFSLEVEGGGGGGGGIEGQCGAAEFLQ